jgi:hypothetical protein
MLEIDLAYNLQMVDRREGLRIKSSDSGSKRGRREEWGSLLWRCGAEQVRGRRRRHDLGIGCDLHGRHLVRRRRRETARGVAPWGQAWLRSHRRDENE